MKKLTITVTEDQYEYLKKHSLKPAWILQDAIYDRMENEIKTSAGILKEAGYLTFARYKKIIDDFDNEITDKHEQLTTHELRSERRRLADLNRRIKKIGIKILEEIEWIDIQLGVKKPYRKNSYKFTYKNE